jgi:hypothetical protein
MLKYFYFMLLVKDYQRFFISTKTVQAFIVHRFY